MNWVVFFSGIIIVFLIYGAFVYNVHRTVYSLAEKECLSSQYYRVKTTKCATQLKYECLNYVIDTRPCADIDSDITYFRTSTFTIFLHEETQKNE